MDSKERLEEQCKEIADFLQQEKHGLNDDGEVYTAYDYLQDVFDIDYIITSNRHYLGARVLVACGGPNIILDTEKSLVIGKWGCDRVEIPFNDKLGLDDALEEMARDLFNVKQD